MTSPKTLKTRLKGLSLILSIPLCLAQANAFAQEDIHVVTDDYWLVSDKHDGLSLVQPTGEVLQRLPGRFGALDSRGLDQSLALVSAVDEESNQVAFFLLKEQKLEGLNSLGLTKGKLDSACLFLDEAGQSIDAFVVLEDLAVEHYRVFDLQKNVWSKAHIRSLPVGTGLVDCHVDDQSATLVVAQEEQGVWQIDARAEGNVIAQPVAMRVPFGALESDIKKVITLPGEGVLLSQPDLNGIVYVSGSVPRESIQLFPVAEEIEVFALHSIDEQNRALSIVYFDGQLKRLSLPYHPAQGANLTSPFVSIKPTHETQPVEHFGDAADDPAIWVNPRKPAKSLVLGTDKQGGLAVYNLQGELTQFLAEGRLNNVDVKTLRLEKNKSFHLAAASNRDKNAITLFDIDSKKLTLTPAGEVPTGLTEIYGLCMFGNQMSPLLYVFVNDKDGRYEQYSVQREGKAWKLSKVREFLVPDQPEGCVADEATGKMFIGVEDLGIWTISADHSVALDLERILSVGEYNLEDDIEGLGIYANDERRLLVVSSQGSDSYALFSADSPYDYQGSFRVVADHSKAIDGSSETDGLDVTAHSLGSDFPKGLLVVQDGRNVMPYEKQNFKFVSMEEVFSKFELK